MKCTVERYIMIKRAASWKKCLPAPAGSASAPSLLTHFFSQYSKWLNNSSVVTVNSVAEPDRQTSVWWPVSRFGKSPLSNETAFRDKCDSHFLKVKLSNFSKVYVSQITVEWSLVTKTASEIPQYTVTAWHVRNLGKSPILLHFAFIFGIFNRWLCHRILDPAGNLSTHKAMVRHFKITDNWALSVKMELNKIPQLSKSCYKCSPDLTFFGELHIKGCVLAKRKKNNGHYMKFNAL